ncbi:curli-like amyloid fiber formation chaperone CsgH [Aeromonas sp. 96A]|uniref:curli-like amyloid fiber formation chaperone CsgH n=1 Tax=Aeromonas TaxID=642 RepID=UPI001F1E518D|nr:curli-like amyloid fiber formation chaperone CsgH [Aeromonas veronii]
MLVYRVPSPATARETEIEPDPSIRLSLNMVQSEQGLSLAPTLLSKRDLTVSVSLLVHGEGAAGSTTQRQSRNLSLQAGVVMAVGKIGLGLRCPYRVEVTALIWQNERLLVEKKEQMGCAG